MHLGRQFGAFLAERFEQEIEQHRLEAAMDAEAFEDRKHDGQHGHDRQDRDEDEAPGPQREVTRDDITDDGIQKTQDPAPAATVAGKFGEARMPERVLYGFD